MPRDIDDLEAHAAKFWPTQLAEREQSTSIIPRLIESQEKFIGILYVADASPTAWRAALQATEGMPGNLFLKHLMVLSDVGGENLKKHRSNMFPDGRMTFHWKDREFTHKFRSSGLQEWANSRLRVDGPGLAKEGDLSPGMEDVAMLLMHGGASIDPGIPDDLSEKCIIGTLIGQKRELDSFVRRRYIWVSRITGGGLQTKWVNSVKRMSESDFSMHFPPGASHVMLYRA